MLQAVAIPSYLKQDPDFADFAGLDSRHYQQAPEDSADTESNGRGSSPITRRSQIGSQAESSASAFSLARARMPYNQLPKECHALDAMLYNILRLNVKGIKSELLSSVMFPSYVQGMIVLYKHMEINRTDRKVRAFSQAEALTFDGDVQKFQIKATCMIRELCAAKCTLMDYALHKVMRAFDGKNKSIQYKIASDIKNMTIDGDTNIYDMIQAYCADIAAVGDDRQSRVNAVDSTEGCAYCKIRGHKEEDCRRKKADDRNGKNGGRFKGDCNYCGKPGHRAFECRKKIADQAAGNSQSSPQQPQGVNVSQDKPPSDSQPVTAVNQNAIQALINHLQASTHRINMIRSSVPDTVAPHLSQIPHMASELNCLDLSLPANTNSFEVLSVDYDQPSRIMLSLCDGAGCAGMAARNCGMVFDRYIAVEVDDIATIVSDNCNSNKGDQQVPSPDHYWRQDVSDITEEDIAGLGANNIKLLAWGAPCEDMSLLRLIRKATSTDDDPRPGLKGPKGKVLLQCLQITQWVLKYNPGCEYIIENVVFPDLKEDWELVCKAIGEPMIINSALVSFTKRNRAWWSNFKNLPPDLTQLIADRQPLVSQASECMDQGRTVQTYKAYGIDCIRPIGKSWSGSDDRPSATTSRPVLVTDEMHDQPQQLRPHEAERLMGMSGEDTAGSGVTAKERLKCIGNGWDMNVANMLFSRSALATQTPPQSVCPTAASGVNTMLAAISTESIPVMEELTAEELETQATLVTLVNTAPDELAGAIAQAAPEEQTMYLALLKHHYASGVMAVTEGAILDSGSSKHLDTKVFAPNGDDRKSLSGFDNSQQWTEGNGYLPLTIRDHLTGEEAKIEIEDVDQLPQVTSRILSVGKLLRKGYKFYFENADDLMMVTPGGAHKVKVELSEDDIIRLPNQVRTGDSIRPLPKLSEGVHALKRTAGAATAQLLHDVLNHTSAEKVYRTLGATKGYQQKRFEDVHCDTCARAKARSFGLSRKHTQPCPYGCGRSVC
jgi:hypothetical protein